MWATAGDDGGLVVVVPIFRGQRLKADLDGNGIQCTVGVNTPMQRLHLEEGPIGNDLDRDAGVNETNIEKQGLLAYPFQ